MPIANRLTLSQVSASQFPRPQIHGPSPSPAPVKASGSATNPLRPFIKFYPKMSSVLRMLGSCSPGSCPPQHSANAVKKNPKVQDPSDLPPKVSGNNAAERTLKLIEYIEDHQQHGLYQAKTHIDLDDGTFQCDCSGLVNWILSGSAPQALQEVLDTMNKKQSRPVVATFVATLKKMPIHQPSTGWQRITKIADTQPGDMIAWPTPDWYPSEATGHMGIVVEKPEAVAGGYLVRIADSTSYPHGEDTRREGSGFGYGTVLITIDETTGEGTGQGWTGKNSEATVIRTPIYVGRPLN